MLRIKMLILLPSLNSQVFIDGFSNIFVFMSPAAPGIFFFFF